MKRKPARLLTRLFGVYLPLAAFVFFALFPFYWMLISSFKANPELYSLKANRLWIANPTLDQFRDLFAKTAIIQWLWNSFFVSFLTAFISMTFGIMAGYALARLKFPGAQAFGLATFITYLVPTTLIFIPLARVVQSLGLSDSIWALVVTYPTFLIPFCTWMLISSFKANPELYNLRANRLWIKHPTLEQFQELFKRTAVIQWLWNSFFVSFLTSMISMTFGIMAGYALARLKFPGARAFGLATFITYLVPTTLIFIPLARVVQSLGLSNSIWSLVVTYPTFLIPFCTWMLIAYFKSIPKDMEECAMIDGCSRIGAMVRIVLPMAVPGVIFSAMFSFTLSWNEFVYALTFISATTHKTMSVAVPTELIRGDAYFWGELMAASLLGSVPVAILYSFFMEYFVSGLTAGALKG